MTAVHLDTHVVVWLGAELVGSLSGLARRAIERAETLEVSPMVVHELAVLHELGRIGLGPGEILGPLAERVGLGVSDLGFGDVVEHAASLRWTREPCDRLITAQAELAEARLVTKDRLIRANSAAALW